MACSMFRRRPGWSSVPRSPVPWRARSSLSRRRSFSSPAAFSVKVTASIWSTRALPVARTLTIRVTSSVVFPVPAAASTSSDSSSEVRIRSRSAASTSMGSVMTCSIWIWARFDSRCGVLS